MRNVLAGLILLGLTVNAQTSNLSSEIQERSLMIEQLTGDFYSKPGSMCYRDSLSLSSASLEAGREKKNRSIIPQNGLGSDVLAISAQSCMHLDQQQTVWGNAQFSTGSLNDVKWSNCIDYQLVAPYVLGDSVGGDMSFRKYIFGGGYERLLNKKWSIGAQLNYRAEIAWRNRDPRVKTIVSDLNVLVGASFLYTQNRFLALTASIISYSQNCDLEFYSPINDINTLPLTGLGSYNHRFSGNTNKNSGHNGFGGSVNVRWCSVDKEGFQAEAGFQKTRMKEQLRNFNNLTLAYTDSYLTRIAAYFHKSISPAIKICPTAEGRYFRRLGTENLFGSAAGSSYVKIGSRTPYLSECSNIAFMLPIQIKIEGSYLTIAPRLALDRIETSLTSLNRSLSSTSLNNYMNVQFSRLSGKWLFDVKALYSFSHSISNAFHMPGFDSESALQTSVKSTFDMLTADEHVISCDISLNRSFGKLLAGMAIGYSHSYFAGLAKSNDYHISLKINF